MFPWQLLLVISSTLWHPQNLTISRVFAKDVSEDYSHKLQRGMCSVKSVQVNLTPIAHIYIEQKILIVAHLLAKVFLPSQPSLFWQLVHVSHTLSRFECLHSLVLMGTCKFSQAYSPSGPSKTLMPCCLHLLRSKKVLVLPSYIGQLFTV